MVRYLAIGLLALLLGKISLSIDCANYLTENTANFPSQLAGRKKGHPVVFERHAPRPIQEITIIVPVYRELYNSSLYRFLHSINHRQFSPQLRVIFVVNNTQEVASNGSDPVWIENQLTLKFLKDSRNPILNPLKAAGVKFEVMDFSTQGIERNIGRIRNLGFARAMKLSKADPDRHLIIQMDADCVMEPTYLMHVATYYTYFPVDVLITSLRYSVPSSTDSLLVPTFYQFGLYAEMSLLIRGIEYAYRGAGSPQITSTAKVLLEIGGIPEISYSEDFELMKALRPFNWHYSEESHIYTEDRSRSDGYDAAIRETWTHRNSKINLPEKNGKLALAWLTGNGLRNISKTVEKGKLNIWQGRERSEKWIRGIGVELPRPAHNILDWWKYTHQVINAWKNAGLEFKDSYVPLVYDYELETHEDKTFYSALYDLFLNALSPTERQLIQHRYEQETQNHDQLVQQRNLWIDRWIQHPLVAELRDLKNDPFLFWLTKGHGKKENLRLNYPDWLLPLQETPFKDDYVKLQILREFIMSSHNSIGTYPSGKRLLRWAQGEIEEF